MYPVAIACGNAFILKPSERDPSPSLFMAELLKQAGLPDGIFSVVQGDKVAVDTLLKHPDVKALSFVGSTPIAQYVYETGHAATASAPSALGGAKNHMLIMPDADMDKAVDALIGAGLRLGRRALHGDFSVAVPVGEVGDRQRRWSKSSFRACEEAEGRSLSTDREADYGPAGDQAKRQGARQGLYRHRRQGRREASSRRWPRLQDAGLRKRLFSPAVRCSTT